MNPPQADHETGNPLAGLSGAQRGRIIWPSFSASRKPGVLGCRLLRRTVQVRLGINTLCLPSGTTIFMVATGDSWNIRDRLHAAILDYLPLSGFFNPISRKNICNFNCRSASVHLKSLPLYKVYKTCFPTLAGRFLLVW